MNSIFLNENKLTSILLTRLYNRFTKPEQEIVTEGSKNRSLFFLVNGECVVKVTDKEKVK